MNDAAIAPTPGRPVGLRCPKCGRGRFRVIYTRAVAGGRVVRRRACRHCAARITTWERIVGA
jgi:transcriptional regulator NrdR family protein